ncbi:hypothetical protein GPECTOR_8g12 [Gonium pectorale]|uniref:Uncharacterized protein n=1 Tax=Gonium pectorale TaxID=33097 RepID=A0A150GS95_GONPE|nr:hypothetical protein GPECTOR_8g12 [Gonium pectorale]|eukprot:KXZ52726.1 hypothetical protein GPECTOR_8g12 [Gonium pectorale]
MLAPEAEATRTAAVPLATLPVLLLPPSAAAEVRRLHVQTIGAAAAAAFEQLLMEPPRAREAQRGSATAGASGDVSGGAGANPAVVGAAGAVSCLDMRRCLRPDQHALLTASMAAISHGGLHDLTLDLGCMLRGAPSPPPSPSPSSPPPPPSPAPQGGEAAAAAACLQLQQAERSAAEAEPELAIAPGLWLFGETLRFLQEHHMDACVREVLHAICAPAAHAGEARTAGGEVAAAAATVSGSDEMRMQAVTRPRLPEAPQTLPAQLATAAGEAAAGAPSISAPPGAMVLAAAAAAASGDGKAPQLAPTRSGPQAPQAQTNGLPPSARQGQRRPLLRASLRGFEPASLEASYQVFKADQCAGLDLTGLLLMGGIRTATTVRTFWDGPGAANWRLQLASQAAFLASVLALLLLTCTLARPAYRRRARRQALPLTSAGPLCCFAQLRSHKLGWRNVLLQLRVLFDAVVLLLMLCTLPPPLRAVATGGRASVLVVPDAWAQSCRRHPLHWVLHCLLEPAIFQLSPYLQARVAATGLLPLFLLARHYALGRWRPAALFATAYALSTLATSVLTDVLMRRRFMRERADATAADPAAATAATAAGGSGGAPDDGAAGKPPVRAAAGGGGAIRRRSSKAA